MREPDVFLRYVIDYKDRPRRRVFLEKCQELTQCGIARSDKPDAEICPHCPGAILTQKERAFLSAKRIGEKVRA